MRRHHRLVLTATVVLLGALSPASAGTDLGFGLSIPELRGGAGTGSPVAPASLLQLRGGAIDQLRGGVILCVNAGC